MDTMTHGLVPYAIAVTALGFLSRRSLPHDARARTSARDPHGDVWHERAALAVVFGVAAIAPDLDFMTDPLSEWSDGLYWLQHRGFSHTLIGAPLFALAAVAALAGAARRWRHRFRVLRWQWAFLPVAVIGAWVHLLMDWPTLAGVPLLWPFSFERVSLQFYHWLVIWLFPVSGVILLAHVTGRLSYRSAVTGAMLVVVVLLVIAGVRAVSFPDGIPEDAQVFPRGAHTEWMVVTPLPDDGGYTAHLERWGARSQATTFHASAPPEAADAIARARDTDVYRGFLMGQYGPVVTQATRAGDGWNVTFIDVAQRFEALNDPRWTPTTPYTEWGYVAFVVRDGDITATHRGW